VFLRRLPNCSQVGIPGFVARVFVSSAGPKISEGSVLDLAHFGQVWVPPGAGLLGDPSGSYADAERSQDQVVQVVEFLFVLYISSLWCW